MAKRNTYSLGALLFTGLGMWVVGVTMGARAVARACQQELNNPERNPQLRPSRRRFG